MTITQQEQEALSRRYGNSIAIIVPLSTGEYAVFSSDRTSESMVIVDDIDNLGLAITSRANMHQRKTPSKGKQVDLNMKGMLD